jgi:proline dehydrogenase
VDFTTIARKVILTVAGNRVVSNAAKRYGLKLGANRFVAGTTLDAAIDVCRDLNKRGIVVTLDHLGESVLDTREAAATVDAYLALLDAIKSAGVNSNVSLKLTAMGLSFDPALARQNVEKIVARAAELDNFVRIDMEDTPYTTITIDIAKDLYKKYGHVGTVIQSYLYRSEQDVQDLGALHMNLRIVKGAYKEPANLAYPRKADVDENYKKLVALHLKNGNYTAIATHDENMIAWAQRFVTEHNIPRTQFEFQMLYGVRMNRQEELAREGYKVRCYVPYGEMWYPYFTRRLAERPANVGFILKNLFKG